MHPQIYKTLTDTYTQNAHGVWMSDYKPSEFESLYTAVRNAEGWNYEGDRLRRLPDTDKSDPLHHFWNSRRRSTRYLLAYLRANPSQKRILDMGCGNGWQTHMLAAQFPDTLFLGVDIVMAELNKAAATFQLPNLYWMYADPTVALFLPNSFNTILMSASAQYISGFESWVRLLLSYLDDGGTIIITDTPFYSEAGYIKAKERTAAYYSRLQFPEMQAYYHHRRYSELDAFNCDCTYVPRLYNRLLLRITGKPVMPFPILVIKK